MAHECIYCGQECYCDIMPGKFQCPWWDEAERETRERCAHKLEIEADRLAEVGTPYECEQAMKLREMAEALRKGEV